MVFRGLALVCLIRGENFKKQGKHGLLAVNVSCPSFDQLYIFSKGIIDFNIDKLRQALGHIFRMKSV